MRTEALYKPRHVQGTEMWGGAGLELGHNQGEEERGSGCIFLLTAVYQNECLYLPVGVLFLF